MGRKHDHVIYPFESTLVRSRGFLHVYSDLPCLLAKLHHSTDLELRKGREPQ